MVVLDASDTVPGEIERATIAFMSRDTWPCNSLTPLVKRLRYPVAVFSMAACWVDLRRSTRGFTVAATQEGWGVSRPSKAATHEEPKYNNKTYIN